MHDCRECGLLTTEPHRLRHIQSWSLPESGLVSTPGFPVAGLRDATFPEDGIEDAACVTVADGCKFGASFGIVPLVLIRQHSERQPHDAGAGTCGRNA